MKRLIRRLGLGITWAGLGLYSVRETLRLHLLTGKNRSIPLTSPGPLHDFNFSEFSRLLIANHVRQFNASSCSAASAVTVINALRHYLDPDQVNHIVSQAELLDTIRSIHWKERVSRRGHNGRRGLPLDIFGQAMEACLHVFEIPFQELDVVGIDKTARNFDSKQNLLNERLLGLRDDPQGVLIAHFDQGVFVPGLHLPHISPVGAFDPETRRVLVLDVDPVQKSPYWTPFSVFIEGLAGNFGGWLRRYGYNGGGYVWIKLRSRS